MTYYVIDTRCGEIVNACDADGGMNAEAIERHLSRMTDGEHFVMKPEPEVPLHVLKRYRYWDERP